MRELAELRAEVAACLPAPVAEHNGLDAGDLAHSNLLDTTSAQERFGEAHDRPVVPNGVGVRRGGRWPVPIPRAFLGDFRLRLRFEKDARGVKPRMARL